MSNEQETFFFCVTVISGMLIVLQLAQIVRGV